MKTHTTFNAVLGKVVTYLRKENKVTQKELSQYMEITPSALSKIENGETTISIAQMISISERFNMKTSEFVMLIEYSVDLLEKKGVPLYSKIAQQAAVATVPIFGGVLLNMMSADLKTFAIAKKFIEEEE